KELEALARELSEKLSLARKQLQALQGRQRVLLKELGLSRAELERELTGRRSRLEEAFARPETALQPLDDLSAPHVPRANEAVQAIQRALSAPGQPAPAQVKAVQKQAALAEE